MRSIFLDKGIPRVGFEVNERIQVVLLGIAGGFEFELDIVLLALMYDGDKGGRHGASRALKRVYW